jgi:UPF0716 protein FxsA
MFDMNTLLRLLDRGFIVKFFLLLLLFSLVLLADGYLLLFLAPFVGTYAILALTASACLLGMIMIVNAVHRKVYRLRLKVKEGTYPADEFVAIAGLLTAGILLVIPGLFTSLIGLVLTVPVFRQVLGRRLTRNLEPRLKQVYEYMKIEEY